MATPGLLRRSLPTFAALGVTVLTTSLGFWQLDRARQRDALDQRLTLLRAEAPVELGATPVDAARLELHPAAASGHWRSEGTVLLDNQPQGGRPGFHVLTPLQIAGSDMHVLVVRGWLAASGDRLHTPTVVAPVGEQRVAGFVRQRPPHYLALGDGQVRREGTIWSDVTPAGYAAWSGLKLQPLVLYQTGSGADGLVRDWPLPGSGADRNRGYAFQWFGLAAMTAVFWVATHWRRKKL